MKTAFVLAYAKLNLSLAIRGRRPDGFHEINSIVQTIDLADRLTIEVLRGTRSTFTTHSRISKGLTWPALPPPRSCRPRSPHAESIRISKRIPAAAGLGGASSDAAAVLLTLDRLIPPTLSNGAGTASRLGSDVPLFLVGGLVLTGRGEVVWRLARLAASTMSLSFPRRAVPQPTSTLRGTARSPRAAGRDSRTQ